MAELPGASGMLINRRWAQRRSFALVVGAAAFVVACEAGPGAETPGATCKAGSAKLTLDSPGAELVTVRYGEALAVRGRVVGDDQIKTVRIGHGGLAADIPVRADRTFEHTVVIRDVTAPNIDVRAADCAGGEVHAWRALGVVGFRRMYLTIRDSGFTLRDAPRRDGILSRAMLLKSRLAAEERPARWRMLRVELLDASDRTIAEIYTDDPLVQERESGPELAAVVVAKESADTTIAIPDHPAARSVKLTRFDARFEDVSLGKAVLP